VGRCSGRNRQRQQANGDYLSILLLPLKLSLIGSSVLVNVQLLNPSTAHHTPSQRAQRPQVD